MILDFDRDVWGYIALGNFRQRVVEGEVGSSTMPHKVNPIDFELRGQRGRRERLAGPPARKLPVLAGSATSPTRPCCAPSGRRSRTPSLLACRAEGHRQARRRRGAPGRRPRRESVLTTIQTVMRRYGIENPYEQLSAKRAQSRRGDAARFVSELDIPDHAKAELNTLTPAGYVGDAEALTRDPRGGVMTTPGQHREPAPTARRRTRRTSCGAGAATAGPSEGASPPRSSVACCRASRAAGVATCLLGIVLVYVACMGAVGIRGGLAFSGYSLRMLGAMHPPAIVLGEYWRFVSSAWLHGDLLHLLFNAYALLSIGPLLERAYGKRRFLVLWFVAGAVSMIGSFGWSWLYAGAAAARTSVGASGAICGLIGAMYVVAFRLKNTAAQHAIQRWGFDHPARRRRPRDRQRSAPHRRPRGRLRRVRVHLA